MSYKILLLEDDILFNETIEDFLEEEGFDVYSALDPYTSLDLTYENRFDLYLFDVNLPYESGFTLLKRLRMSGDRTPTIFLTSREDKESMVEGFTIGGDDYMKKPIDLDELLLRVNAILRRESRLEELDIFEYTIDIKAKKLYYRGEIMSLTTKAVELLILLILADGKIVTIESIEDRLWNTNEEVSRGAIRVYITTLKKYFPKNIKNIRGVGYYFVK